MLDIQTIRNLYEAYLQTCFLSAEDIADLLWITWRNWKIVAKKFFKIRDEYLDNLENNSEEHIEEYIDRLCDVVWV